MRKIGYAENSKISRKISVALKNREINAIAEMADEQNCSAASVIRMCCEVVLNDERLTKSLIKNLGMWRRP